MSYLIFKPKLRYIVEALDLFFIKRAPSPCIFMFNKLKLIPKFRDWHWICSILMLQHMKTKLQTQFDDLFVCFVSKHPRQQLGYIAAGPKTERLTILCNETELRNHDFSLSRSHYTDTYPTSRERAATVVIETGTSSSEVARSTDWATAPLLHNLMKQK